MMCQERYGIFSIEAMVRGYHVYKSIWAAVGEEFGALAKNRYTETSFIASAAALETACGIGLRSRAPEKNFAYLIFIFV